MKSITVEWADRIGHDLRAVLLQSLDHRIGGKPSLCARLPRIALAPLFLLLLAGWSAYIDAGRRPVAIGTVLVALSVILPPMVTQKETPADWITWVAGLGLIWITCYALARQQQLLVELRAAQASLAAQAAAEERRRIAHEIHDVIAHALAVTLLHITGARHVLARDPEQAAAALATAEQLGRQSLADIRRTVGLLATGPADGRAPPLPDAAAIPDLVASYRAAGLPVRFTVTGEPSRVPPAAALALYRIVQEALANVAKHAPGADTSVDLALDEAWAALAVANGARRAGAVPLTIVDGGGQGIAGMRERAALLGGTLCAGPEGDGWAVTGRIPLTGVAPPPPSA